MELEFLVRVNSAISTEAEVRWYYICIAEEVEKKESTAVRYLIQWMLPRPYTLECTLQTLVLVSDVVCKLLVCSAQIPNSHSLWLKTMLQRWRSLLRVLWSSLHCYWPDHSNSSLLKCTTAVLTSSGACRVRNAYMWDYYMSSIPTQYRCYMYSLVAVDVGVLV